MPSRAALGRAWDEAGTLLGALRALGVNCRFDPDTHQLLWKPQFTRLPVEMQDDIREKGIAIVRLLVPLAPGQPSDAYTRPGWTHGVTKACVGCSESAITYDPLGQPRHPWCGWFDQAAIHRPIVHSAKVRRMQAKGGGR